ncbi:MAG: hypoxanthine phosphoribosyltransferase [Lentisphaeria bacterium]|nr:hypoxanthine phosphoribosyltransferase [Lentisphaeria bacterium]
MEILVPEEQIARRVQELAAEITAYYREKPLTVIILMNGGLLFGADLVRAIRLPLRWDVFSVSSYANDCSSGELKIRSSLKNPVAGRHLLVVDDILDSGLTLKKVMDFFEPQGALSVRSCVLLNKHVSGKSFLRPDWVGFEIPDRYVIGYGMDSNEEYRNLPYIAVKDPD